MTRVRLFLWMLAAALIVGCGDGSATVSGTVTLDDQPIVGGPQMYGTVSFYRADGSGAPAIGIIDASGGYTLKTGTENRVEPGPYAIAIAVKRIDLPTTPEGMPRPHLVTPEKYASVTTSGLQAEVAPGSNTFDFQLDSETAID